MDYEPYKLLIYLWFQFMHMYVIGFYTFIIHNALISKSLLWSDLGLSLVENLSSDYDFWAFVSSWVALIMT